MNILQEPYATQIREVFSNKGWALYEFRAEESFVETAERGPATQFLVSERKSLPKNVNLREIIPFYLIMPLVKKNTRCLDILLEQIEIEKRGSLPRVKGYRGEKRIDVVYFPKDKVSLARLVQNLDGLGVAGLGNSITMPLCLLNAFLEKNLSKNPSYEHQDATSDLKS